MRKQPRARTTKSKSRQDNFYEIEKVAKRKIEDKQVDLQMKMSRLGGKIAEFKKVYKSFGEKTILSGFDYTFKKGERIGIIGKNGAGKSTFVNMLQGLEEPDSGKINIGDTIIFGNYSQQGLVIKQDMRVIEYVKNIAEHFPLANGATMSAAQFLELFLFTPDTQYSFISKLSGGEKRRLHLLTILFKNPNFLVLDEPTNDLDLPTLSVLENFLMDFPGCLIIISHDRYFMDRIVDHLFVFEGDGVIRDFPGNYAEYREELNEKTVDPEKIKSQIIVNREVVEETKTEKRKPSFNEKREFEMLEKDIKKLNLEKTEISEKLSDSNLDYPQIEKYSTRFREVSEQIDEKELRWLELSEIF
jgi:ATP-binding cassette subfamily F protein uup